MIKIELTNELLTEADLRAIYDKCMFTGESMPEVTTHYHVVKAPKVITPEHQKEALKELNNKGIHNAVQAITNKIVNSIDHQEDPKNRTISECEIIPNGYLNEIWIKSNCDGWCEDVKLLYTYYSDELSFSSDEFIGISEESASQKCHNRDIAYLRS